jgi:membrane protein
VFTCGESRVAAVGQRAGDLAMLRNLTVGQLVRTIWQNIYQDNSLGRAAELAFYFTFALFPMLIFLLSVISFIPGAQEILLDWFSTLIPREAMSMVRAWVESVFGNRSGGLLSFSLFFSLWAASNGVGALMHALNDAYKVKEGRPYWKAQLVAIGLTIALCLLVMGGSFLITFGEKPAEWIADFLRLGSKFALLWLSFSYIVGFAMLLIGMVVVYYVAPNVKQKWSWIFPGAFFSVVALVGVSLLFSLYLRYAPSYSLTYGSLGTFIVLMMWLYLLGLILCVGGEINAEIQDVSGRRVVVKEKAEPEKAKAATHRAAR